MDEQITKAQADAQHIAREKAEQQQRQLIADREAEQRAARQQEITYSTAISYSRSSTKDDCIVS